MKFPKSEITSVLYVIFNIFPYIHSFRSHNQFLRYSNRNALKTILFDAVPGSPEVKNINKETNVAVMTVVVSAEATQKAFSKSCDLFNEEVKARGYTVPGFRPGSKLPPAYLYQIFGEDKIKLFCGNLLSDDIQDECEKTGLMFVGRGRIITFNEESFNPGKPHPIDIECDLWPTITYRGEKGYKGLVVTVNSSPTSPEDNSKIDAVKKSIKERYKVLADTPVGYSAQLGDVVVANMRGYERGPDGSKGSPLPAIASGDQVEITMEPGRFMVGMVEALVGCQIGDIRSVSVTFPVRPSGPGAALSGKEAIFEVTCLNVKTKTIPQWDAELADRVRSGMSLSELDEEVRKAVEGEAEGSREGLRNEAIAAALLQILEIDRLPESLMEENTQARFQSMLADFQEQGSSQEQLAEMSTPEKYEKYRQLSRTNVEKVVKLGMAFRDIAEKESVAVTAKEIQDQVDLLTAQAKQKGEPLPDERRVRDEVENTLLRRKVFDHIASFAQITFVTPPPDSSVQN